MSYQPYYISAFEGESGLNNYYEPFLIPEKAFTRLEDCYCFRAKVIKRLGYQLLGRLRRVITAKVFSSTIDGSIATFNVLTEIGISLADEPNATLRPGTTMKIVIAGADINSTLTDLGNGTMSTTPGSKISGATINYNTGVLTLTFVAGGPWAASTATFTGDYFPGLPVMGLRLQEQIGVNEELTLAFDQKYAYQFNNTTNLFEEYLPATATVWHGNDFNFFWSTNFSTDGTTDLCWVTNTQMTAAAPNKDPIRYTNGAAWTVFQPRLDPAATSFLTNAEIILPFKGRLLFINTYEGATAGAVLPIDNSTHFQQRIRWSWVGDPTNDTLGYDSVTPGRGGFVDLPTNEVIIGAEYLKDLLLIKCERSSWKIFDTGNASQPFDFQKINTELGSESKFSLVPFDRGVLAIGNYGITTDDSVNVSRIDVVIPDLVFNFQNSEHGVVRAQGIRDFTNEVVYWCYPSSGDDIIYPNKILLYNYRNNTFATFNDSFTCFGYYQPQANTPWNKLGYPSWYEWTTPWNVAIDQARYPKIVGGNQQGFVEVLAQQTANDPSLFIYGITFAVDEPTFNIPNHNLQSNDVIKITGIIGDIGTGTVAPTQMNGKTYLVNRVDESNITLKYYDLSSNTFLPMYPDLSGNPGVADVGNLYFGGGVIAKINGIGITTKVFTPFYEEGSQCRLGYIDYLFFKTNSGQVTANVYVDENPSTAINDPTSLQNIGLVGTNIVNTCPENTTLIPYQQNQNKIWHRQFIQTIAQNFQVDIGMTPLQMANEEISTQDVTLNALAFYISKNARLVQ